MPAARRSLRVIDRHHGPFPTANSPSQLSVLSWNLLAPSHHGDTMEEMALRFQRIRQCLRRYAGFDVLCFQEVDLKHGAVEELCSVLTPQGFTPVVQDRGCFGVVNAVFYREDRFKLSWVQHRSRVLLLGLLLRDGRELALGNVHLQAGSETGETRKSQLSSALRRLAAREPWCTVLCGDFNSPMTSAAGLLEQLKDAGLTPAPNFGPTIAVQGYSDELDHICASKGVKVCAVLGSSRAALRGLAEAGGCPNAENPSDHLPVGAVMSVERWRPRAIPAVEAPAEAGAGLRREWLEILRHGAQQAALATKQQAAAATKRAAKEQRQLEADFLGLLTGAEAEGLRGWRAAASEAARLLVADLARTSVARLLATAPCESKMEAGGSEKQFDPGGLDAAAWLGS